MNTLTVEYPKGNITLTCYDNFYTIKDQKGYGKIEHSNKDKNELIKQLEHEINTYTVELNNPMHDENHINRVKMVIKANNEMIGFLNNIQ